MGKTCRYQKDLSLFYYGELDPLDRFLVKEHLASCPDCQDHLQQLSCLLDRLPRPELEISPAEINRFAARVAERAVSGRFRRPSLQIWGGALAAAAVLIVTLIAERPQQLAPVGGASTQVAELEMLQRLELLQDFELLQDLELLTELEGRG
jgi:anti-sigma factor RsiW